MLVVVAIFLCDGNEVPGSSLCSLIMQLHSKVVNEQNLMVPCGTVFHVNLLCFALHSIMALTVQPLC